MSDRRKQAEHALRVYLDRGSKALSSLQRGEVDHANEWLSKREAAFRNFLALEHSAKKDESDGSIDVDFKEMFEAASQQNMLLKRQLSEAMTDRASRSRNLTASSRIIGKFVSGNRRNGFSSAG